MNYQKPNHDIIKELKKTIEEGNKKFGEEWVVIDPNSVEGTYSVPPFKVVRNRRIMVQMFHERDNIIRLSINRCEIQRKADPPFWEWKDGLTWNDLQKIKNELGFSDHDAVEIFPKECDEVSVANMRHLWIMPIPLWFAWRKPVEAPKIQVVRDMANAKRIINNGGKIQ